MPVPKISKPTIHDLRPISLLPVPSKILERLITTQLTDYFTVAAGANQHGGIRGSSTTTASIVIHEQVTKMLDDIDVTGVQIMAYDLKKAFDSLGHAVILKRLIDCHFPPYFVNLMSSYLFDRTQSVRVDTSISEVVHVTSGISQGSVFGPLLFNAVCGGLKPLNSKYSIIKYIDDITICVPL